MLMNIMKYQWNVLIVPAVFVLLIFYKYYSGQSFILLLLLLMCSKDASKTVPAKHNRSFPS